jgi:metal-dependent HD superfamily phosphatase/phosphodiesterase
MNAVTLQAGIFGLETSFKDKLQTAVLTDNIDIVAVVTFFDLGRITRKHVGNCGSVVGDGRCGDQ